MIFKPNKDKYIRDRSIAIDLGTAAKIKCFVAYANNTIIVVGGNGRIAAVEATKSESLPAIEPPKKTGGIETIASSPDGKWIAMVYANQQLWLMDVDNDRKLFRPSVTGSSNTSSVSFDADSRLCVFDRENRLTVYETASLKSTQSFAPEDGIFELSYRYLVSPLYTVFPKPGEFSKVISYLSSAQSTTDNAAIDLIYEPIETNPLLPLWSGLGFMASDAGIVLLDFPPQGRIRLRLNLTIVAVVEHFGTVSAMVGFMVLMLGIFGCLVGFFTRKNDLDPPLR